MGNDVSAQSLGIMPCAVAWLFRLIDEQKEKTGARFSVRVSAVEVSGKNEQLQDLLAEVAKCKSPFLEMHIVLANTIRNAYFDFVSSFN